MKGLIKLFSGLVLSCSLVGIASATPIDTYQFKNTTNEKRAITLASELRCPQCQNQNLVDSNSPVARDLRLEVYKMVDAGKSDNQIIEFMTSRYGDFVLYMPRLESKTYILWGGPIVLFIIGLMVVFVFVRRQKGDVAQPPELSAEDQQQLDELLKQAKK